MGYLVFSEQLVPIVLGGLAFYFSHANFYTLAISAFLLGTGKLFFDVSYRKLIPREAIFIATLGLMFSAFILALPQVRQFKLEASEHHTQSGLG